MEIWLPWIYDAIAVCMLLSYIYGAAQRGFAATLANLVGYMVSLAVAWPLARFTSSHIYDLFLRDNITNRVEGYLNGFPEGIELVDAASSFLEALPPYLSRLVEFEGRSASELAALLSSYSSDGAHLIVDELIAPMLQGVLSTILFVVFFSLLLCVVRAITRMLRRTNRLPVIGPVNSILGGALGAVTGAVCVYVLFLLLRLASQITGNELWFVNTTVISQTYTWRILNLFGPLRSLNLY